MGISEHSPMILVKIVKTQGHLNIRIKCYGSIINSAGMIAVLQFAITFKQHKKCKFSTRKFHFILHRVQTFDFEPTRISHYRVSIG